MIALIIIVVLLVLVVFLIGHGAKGNSHESRYEKTGSFMDFDQGVDSDKVGDPKYPNAGVDSVMKHEFLDDLMDGKK